MGYEDYDVLSYFINVGAGDSAVHILRNRHAPNIEAAVLIDGGRATAIVAVGTAIAGIRNELNQQFVFKSIVATHWDIDHFAGLMKLLYVDWVDSRLRAVPMSYIDANTTFYCPSKALNALSSIYPNIDIAKDPQSTTGDPLWLRFRPNGGAWVNICRAIVGTYAMGYNLFTGFQHSEESPEPETIREPPTLEKYLEHVYTDAPYLAWGEKPIFLIYGVDGKSFNDEEWEPPKEEWRKKDRKDKNGSSIMALVIWPVPHPDWQMRVSLYTGGDVEQAPEDAMMEWIGVRRARTVRLDVVKASHHGSHFSTSEEFLLQSLQYLVISAGRQYGHPSFAVVYCFLALANLLFLRGKIRPVMLCTRYPYWLRWHPSRLSSDDCNPSTVMSWGDSALAIQACFMAINKPGDNNFLTNYLTNHYGAAFTNAKAYAFLKSKTATEFNNAVLAQPGYPMANTPLPQLPLNSERQYLTDTIEQIQQSIRQHYAASFEPGANNARGARWIKIVAKGNSPTVIRELEDISDLVLIRIQKAAQIWETDDDLAWARLMPDAMAVTAAANWIFTRNAANTYNLPVGVNIAQALMGPAAVVAPGFSVEEWIGSVLMRGLLEARPDLGTRFDEDLVDTESVCAKWFGDCFTSNAFLRLAGTRDQGTVLLKRAGIRLEPKEVDGLDTLQGAGNKPVLFFSTDKAAHALQFGTEAETKQTLPGFDANIQGVLLALDSSCSLTLAQLAGLVNFPLSRSALVSELLGSLELSSYEGSRSGIWFIPEFNSRTILRMAMKPKAGSGIDGLRKLIEKGVGPVKFPDVVVIGTCVLENSGPQHCESSAKLGLQVDIGWEKPDSNLPPFEGKASIDFSADGVELVFKFTHSDNLLESLLAWAKGVMGGKGEQSFKTEEGEPSDPPVREHLSQALGGTSLSVHRVSVGFDKEMKPRSFEISIEVDAPLSGDSAVPFLATVRWNNGAFELSAQIWPRPLLGSASSPFRLHPFWEETSLTTPITANPVYGIPLRSLLRLSDDVHIPPGLPTEITEAQVVVGFGHGRTSASFSATLECDPALAEASTKDNETAAPLLSLGRVSLDVGVDFPTKKEQGPPDVDIRFDACLTLSLPTGFDPTSIPEAVQSPINFRISYQQNSGGYEWESSASIKNLRVAHLCELFARDGSDHAILDIMGGIYVVYAGIEHRYDGGTSLDIDGTLRLGPSNSDHAAELLFKYQHKAEDKSWSFEAHLRPVSSKATLQVASLLSGLVNEAELPGFLRNLEVPLDKLHIDLVCEKRFDGAKKAHALFSLTIVIDDFVLTLAQLRSVASAKSSALARANDSSVLGTADDAGPAQLLRFTLPTVRRVPHMPVVGAVAQPFDQLGIVWTNRDLSAAEVNFFNDNVFSSQPLLSQYKSGDLGPILRGIHFQVAMLEAGKHRLVLDHVVATKKKRFTGVGTGEFQGQDGEAMVLADAVQSSEKTIAPMSKTFGHLTVSSIGLSVSGQSFSNIIISLDAALDLGPVSLNLLGFSLSFNLQGITSLDGFRDLSFEIGIRGMTVDFKTSQTRLAGLFVPFGSPAEADAGFMGAIAVSVAAWSAIAAGMYSENKLDHLKSLFVFGALRGPIFSVGSVEVNGLTGGFGYNSRLKFPSVQQVSEFPFVAMNQDNAPGPPGPLTKQLSTLRRSDGGKDAWVTVAPDDMWLAAGVGLKGFQTVDALVLIALTLSEEPKFMVLAQATAVFPKSAGKSQECAFLVLDIVLCAEIDPLHGTIFVAGELTPRSFILNPSCRLTGGFAFQLFFVGSPYEGDFVFTVGGYNKLYTVPSHYPAAPSRVGIFWQYDSQIRISGEAYFAITPQVAMGGGRLDLVVDKSWVRATFSAWADFFMHYHPFSFSADVGITLWVEVNLPALIYKIHLGPKEISARLSLYGPPMAGYVHLHFWTYNTIVAFGSQASRPPPLSWESFLRMVKNLPVEPDASDAVKAPNHMVTITKGAVPVHENAHPAEEGGNSPDVVEIRATQLEFQVQARVPVLSAKLGETAPFETKGSSSLFARPMQRTEAIADSHLTVTLKRTDTEESQVTLQTANVVMKKVAPALWGRYKEDAPASAVATEEMPQHIMALDIRVLPKQPSDEKLPPIDIATFNGTNLQPGRIPVVEEIENGPSKLEGVETARRGHAHMVDIKAMANRDDKRAQWIKCLIKV
ncbi:hypothetical protein EDB80DRAFT_886738 [Ilyonectria destructans]|nr:hypothetical protein EDB80DRAFT_886738 [Ilyonectria destructans]